jgi:hypothetical protein
MRIKVGLAEERSGDLQHTTPGVNAAGSALIMEPE